MRLGVIGVAFNRLAEEGRNPFRLALTVTQQHGEFEIGGRVGGGFGNGLLEESFGVVMTSIA